MSQKYGNPCATYNNPLNCSENDIFRMGCAHHQHFLHINVIMDDCKPDFSVSIREAEQRNIEHNNSINGLGQSVQQLAEVIKALKDALLQAKENDVVNRIEKAPDVDNNATQKSNFNKQAKNENKSSALPDVDNNAAQESNKRTMKTSQVLNIMILKMLLVPAKNIILTASQSLFDLRHNCVYIENFKCSDSSLEKALYNIRKLTNEMNVEIPEHSVIQINVKRNCKGNPDYYVYFCDQSIKEKFLSRGRPLVYNPETIPLRIFDYSYWRIVDIMNI